MEVENIVMTGTMFLVIVGREVQTTPSKEAAFLIPRFLAAAKLIPMQLIKKPAKLGRREHVENRS